MNSLSIGISAIFAILATAFGVLLLAAILGNQKIARRYRKEMGERLSNLRLSRMLTRHHIDPNTYLHTQPVLDIEQQMKRCSNCAHTVRCDDLLAANGSGDADTSFCDNDDELQSIKRGNEAA
jgi:hypothetical protein